MATRLGVDVGGTFTDLIFYDDETGVIRAGKEPTTPAAPEEGVIAAVAAAVPGESLSAAPLLPARDDRGAELAPHPEAAPSSACSPLAAFATCSSSRAATAASRTTSSGGSPSRSCRGGCGSP